MFFRRQRPKEITFEERLTALKSAGFTVDARGGGVRVSKDNCAAEIENLPTGGSRIVRLGVLVGSEIGLLIDGGFQKFLQAPDGTKVPALASDLKTLHRFEEDLREDLGLESLYNESLGTTCDYHVYDRLEGRGSVGK
jgi:hypothetical protein